MRGVTSRRFLNLSRCGAKSSSMEILPIGEPHGGNADALVVQAPLDLRRLGGRIVGDVLAVHNARLQIGDGKLVEDAQLLVQHGEISSAKPVNVNLAMAVACTPPSNVGKSEGTLRIVYTLPKGRSKERWQARREGEMFAGPLCAARGLWYNGSSKRQRRPIRP